jgi:hypothetical protein
MVGLSADGIPMPCGASEQLFPAAGGLCPQGRIERKPGVQAYYKDYSGGAGAGLHWQRRAGSFEPARQSRL